ncbi:Arginase/deacetylase [Serendipita vermifera]|nr:Arginase/deacetylase [Serendipita vermifera]
MATSTKPKVAVLLQDECYRHRYIRSKDTSLIVERPERLRALKVGFAAAIARLEEEAEASKKELNDSVKQEVTDSESAVVQDAAPAPLDVADELSNVLNKLNLESSSKTVSEGECGVTNVCKVIQLPVTLQYLSSDPAVRMIHAANADGTGFDNLEHIDRLAKWARESEDKIRTGESEIPQGFSQGDLYMCPQSYGAICGAVETVRVAVDTAMKAEPDDARTVFAAIRPPGHHCGEDTPSGFCFVNNVAIAAAHAHLHHKVKRVIIFDIDLHHGNGTQAIAWSINAETHRKRLDLEAQRLALGISSLSQESPGLQIFYSSLHDILSFPCEDGDPNLVRDASISISGAHGQFIENVHLQTYTSHEDFWTRLYPQYRKLFAKAKQFLQMDPEDTNVPVFISCGFDASELEYESMSRHGRKVPVGFYYRFARDARQFAKEHANGRVISVLEGGYSDLTLMGAGMAHLIGLIEDKEGTVSGPESWWSTESLEKLEKACKKKRGKQSIGGVVEPWVERSVEILTTIDPPLKNKPSPTPRSKRPSAAHGTNGNKPISVGSTASSMLLRERRKPQTPPNEKVATFVTETRLHEELKLVKISSRSPRGPNIQLPASTLPPVERVTTPKVADHGERATPDAPGTGSIDAVPPESDLNANAAPSTIFSTNPGQPSAPPTSQTTSAPRKLPRIILRVREPGA